RPPGFKELVEVGVEEGHYSDIIARRNPQAHLSCVDPWKAYDGYREHVSQSKLAAFHDAVVARMQPFGATVIRKFSVDAAKDFADGSLDAVYLDGNHDL